MTRTRGRGPALARELRLSVRIGVSPVASAAPQPSSPRQQPAPEPPPPVPTPLAAERPRTEAATTTRRGTTPVAQAPAPVPVSPSRVRKPVACLVGALLLINLVGLSYYMMPIGERVRSPLHVWLKPSGYVGQTAGIVALAFFLSLYLYPLRKRFRALSFLGGLNRWLDVHIVLGLTVCLFGAVHAAWRFRGVIGLGFWSMVVVAMSGVVGRYLYTRIPRSKSGVALSLDEIEAQRRALGAQIAARTGLPVERVDALLAAAVGPLPGPGLAPAMRSLVASDLARGRALRELRRRLTRAPGGQRRPDEKTLRDVARLARRQILLTQQLTLLDATNRVFRLWHVVHRPVALTALLAVLVHVVVVVTLGVTWFY